MSAQIVLLLGQDGLTNGAIYALLALSIMLVFTVTRVLFIPQGEFAAFSALTMAAIQAGKPAALVWLLMAFAICEALADLWAMHKRTGRIRLRALFLCKLAYPFVLAALLRTLPLAQLPMLVQALLTLALIVPMGPQIYRLFYQPILDAHTRRIVGFEALMRWMHPEHGSISPAQFIPMAESNGLINLLGAWALKAACVQVRHFEQAAGRSLYVSVNVSPRQFRNDQFLGVMDDAMRLSGLKGNQLLLEITEGILMSDPEYAETLLNAIATRNVRIAIDDFGTGYSSLAYLKRFPIAALKIDRAFIKDLPVSIKDAAICNVVLSLASHLNLTTIAEGVENDQQLSFLSKQGCTMIQGYLTGRPLPPEEAILALQTGVLPDAAPRPGAQESAA